MTATAIHMGVLGQAYRGRNMNIWWRGQTSWLSNSLEKLRVHVTVVLVACSAEISVAWSEGVSPGFWLMDWRVRSDFRGRSHCSGVWTSAMKSGSRKQNYWTADHRTLGPSYSY